MSPEPAAVAPIRGREAWRKTLEVRERFLATGDPDRLPPETCGVRREILLSWRRSLLSGVDSAGTDLPRDEDAVPPDRFVRAAHPVLDRLAGQLAGMQAWAFLADAQCRLIRHVVGDPALVPQLEARGAFPGALFGEDIVGTNGLGTAVEQQRPFIVAGSEHFRAYESGATTAGAPVRDPVTRRPVGLLNVNCTYDLTSELLLPFVTGLAQEIEGCLLADRSAAERALAEAVAQVPKRSYQAVVALSEEIFIANAAAVALLDGADGELLRHWAHDASAQGREHAAILRLGPDLVVSARCRPLPGSTRHPGVVVTLAPSAPSAIRAGRTQRTSSFERLPGQLDQARAARLPVLIRGERGTGKTSLARCLHERAGDAGQFTILDATVTSAEPRAWTGQLRAGLAEPAGTVVLQHLDTLDPALVAPTASLVASARARLIATAAERAGTGDGPADRAALAERFPVVLDVPPLRERVADIPALVTRIIAELRPEPPRPRCTAEALTALARGEWPGNIRQLRQVVATALVRSLSCDITVGDLPDGYAGAGPPAHGRHLTRLERAERQALSAALREAGWDREAAARDLGVSRATIYRKMKRLGIRPPAGPPGADPRRAGGTR